MKPYSLALLIALVAGCTMPAPVPVQPASYVGAPAPVALASGAPAVVGLLKGRQEHFILEGAQDAWLRGPLRLSDAHLTIYFQLWPTAKLPDAATPDEQAPAFYLFPAESERGKFYRQVYPKLEFAPKGHERHDGDAAGLFLVDGTRNPARLSGKREGFQVGTPGDYYLVMASTVEKYRVEIFETGAEPGPGPAETLWNPAKVPTPSPTP